MNLPNKTINVREFVERYGERLYSECGEHSNVLNLLGMSDFRLAMFLDSVDRLIYFRNKRTRKKISLVKTLLIFAETY